MNRADAKDVIYTHVRDSWTAATAALSIASPEIRYKDDKRDRPGNEVTWLRVVTTDVSDEQETLRNGDNGRRFQVTGLVMVQIFVPRDAMSAETNSDLLAEAIKTAFRNPRVDSNLEFTGANIVDNVTPEPVWIVVNVTANYQYRQFM